MWVPDPDAVWVSALLLQDYSPGEKHLLLQLSDGKVRHAVSKSISIQRPLSLKISHHKNSSLSSPLVGGPLPSGVLL